MRAQRYHRGIHSRIGVIAVLLWMLAAGALAGSLTASVDRTALAENESLTLTVTYDGQTMDQPDFSALDRDFETASVQQQRQLSLGLGNNSSTTQWILSLLPRRTGDLVIPSFHFKNEISDAIAVTVSKARPVSDASGSIFIETVVDRDRALPQGQVLLTVRLNTSVPLSNVDLPELELDGATVTKIHDTQYQKAVNGREYVVVEMKYAIFPEQAGKLEIPSLTITGVVPDRTDPFGPGSLFGSRGKMVRLRSEAKTIDVQPLPANAPRPWIPARGLSISQRWSNDPEALRVGEPVTRTITVNAQGLTGAQLPPVNPGMGGNVKIYPNQPDISETTGEDGVLGIRRESYAVVPTKAGKLELPPVTIQWWDTEANQMRETSLEGVTLSVAPAAQSDQPQPVASGTGAPEAESDTASRVSPSSLTRLLYASLFANGLLAIAVTLLGLRLIKRPVPRVAADTTTGIGDTSTTDEDTAFKELARETGMAPFRDKVLRWGRLFWHQNRIHTLADIAAESGDEELARQFAALDNALYGGGGRDEADIRAIVKRLKAIRSRGHKSGTRPGALKPLYPAES